jgi:hypothetical protein
MANNEQWVALGKLLAAYSLLCNNISSAFGYLSGTNAESAGVLAIYLRPPEQAHAALKLLEERSRKDAFYAHTLQNMRDALKDAENLSTNDLRLSRVDFDYALCLDAHQEEWSCLNVTHTTEELDRMAMACFEAAISLTVAVGGLRLDEERVAAYEKPDPAISCLGARA